MNVHTYKETNKFKSDKMPFSPPSQTPLQKEKKRNRNKKNPINKEQFLPESYPDCGTPRETSFA
jgi:hypothetical protein